MTINYEGNTPTITCDYCGSTVELIGLYQSGSGVHCPVCIDGDISHGHVGYVHDLRGSGIEERHLIKIGEV